MFLRSLYARRTLLAFAATTLVLHPLLSRKIACAEPEQLKRYARSELHMGVEFQVILYAPSPELADQALTSAMARIAALDKSLSDYDLESELSKLSETTTTREADNPQQFPVVQVSDDLWHVLAAAQDISRQSEGAFDVTVGPLSKLWRRARRWKELPDEQQLAMARQSVGWQFLELNTKNKTAQLLKPNMRLDLGGIAKGYAVHEAVKTVKACGISRVLVRGSGDIAVGDAPPGERGWRIGVAPLNPDDPPQRYVTLTNQAISTSGDARQHLVVNGKRYSHILDPRSGEPVSGRSSVTVIHPRGELADGLDTAASVLGPDQALELINKYEGAELLMVYEDETGKQRLIESSGFKQHEDAE
jgi:thiamine biosynthesis lipoprotein